MPDRRKPVMSSLIGEPRTIANAKYTHRLCVPKPAGTEAELRKLDLLAEPFHAAGDTRFPSLEPKSSHRIGKRIALSAIAIQPAAGFLFGLRFAVERRVVRSIGDGIDIVSRNWASLEMCATGKLWSTAHGATTQGMSAPMPHSNSGKSGRGTQLRRPVSQIIANSTIENHRLNRYTLSIAQFGSNPKWS